jgi:hypothetical protein
VKKLIAIVYNLLIEPIQLSSFVVLEFGVLNVRFFPFGVVTRLNRFSALMESSRIWKVDATEAALRAEPGLDRFP